MQKKKKRVDTWKTGTRPPQIAKTKTQETLETEANNQNEKARYNLLFLEQNSEC